MSAISAAAAMGASMPDRDRDRVLDKGRLYRLDEVARLLHLNEKTVRGYLHSGELAGFKVASRWLVYESDLLAFLEARRNQGGGGPAA
jgi:excisionase family DNA binding protein